MVSGSRTQFFEGPSLLFQGSQATGVEFRTPKGLEVARAGREVIVSGGAYGSPQLLMLSGLGPAQHLQDMGIAVLRDILAISWWDVKLNGGLAPGDTFAHKTGDTDEVSHDGGILELPSGARFIIVVYTALPSSPENDARFGRFMRALRPQLS